MRSAEALLAKWCGLRSRTRISPAAPALLSARLSATPAALSVVEVDPGTAYPVAVLMHTIEPPKILVAAATGGSIWLPSRRSVLRSWVSAVMEVS